MLERDHGSRFRLERRTTGESMEKGRPERIDVAAKILERRRVQLLRRDVIRCTPHLARALAGLLLKRGQAEVDDLCGVGIREEDVSRLYVAVNQSARERRI